MTGHGEKLTRKKEQAIAALLSEPSISRAAKTASIGENSPFACLTGKKSMLRNHNVKMR
jgi:hypothetical protein